MQKYDLDLETLLSLLEETRQSGVLFANVPANRSVAAAGCQIRLDLVDGKIVYCHIEDNEGRVQVLGNQKSLSLLYDMGILEWHLDLRTPDTRSYMNPSSSNLSQKTTAPLPRVSPYATVPMQKVSLAVPRPTGYAAPGILQLLSRNQRRVLVLVDGTRNIEKISALLFPSSHDTSEVFRALRELERLRLITIDM